MDLEGSQELQDMDVALVSIATDSLQELSLAAKQSKIHSPLLHDEGRAVSRAYNVLQWAMLSGEPGHTFVLVGMDGKVKWIRDYGARENGGLMYVPVDTINQEVRKHLQPP